MKKYTLLSFFIAASLALFAQVNIQPGTRVTIQPGAYMVLQGNLTSSMTIFGTGTVVMKGTVAQNLNTNGSIIPNLRIDNPAHVNLTGNVRIGNSLNFVNGKLRLGNSTLILNPNIPITGFTATRFIETNGAGRVNKLVTSNLANAIVPIGFGNNYNPVALTTSGTYVSASISLSSRGVAHPNKPVGATHYLNTYWTIARAGITGNVTAAATYANANIVGTEANMEGFLRNGATWTQSGVTINTATNVVSAPITGTGGDIYAMNDVLSLRITRNNAEEVREQRSLKAALYPNPARSHAIISMEAEQAEMATIAISDANGKIVQLKHVFFNTGSNQHRLNLQSLSNGIYEVRVKSVSGDRSFRVVKQ